MGAAASRSGFSSPLHLGSPGAASGGGGGGGGQATTGAAARFHSRFRLRRRLRVFFWDGGGPRTDGEQQSDDGSEEASTEEDERAALASFMTPELPDDAPSALRRAAASLSAPAASSSSAAFLAASEVPLAAVPAINAYWRRVLAAHGLSSVADLVGTPPKSYDSPKEGENGAIVNLDPGSRVRLAGVVVGARTPPMSFAARRKLVPYTVDVDVTDAIAERFKNSSSSSPSSSSLPMPMPRVILRVTRFAAGRAAYAVASKNSQGTPVGTRVVVDGGVRQRQESQQYRQWEQQQQMMMKSSSSPDLLSFPPLVELESSAEVLPALDPRVLGRGDVSPVYGGKTSPSLRPERLDELVCLALEVLRDPTPVAMMMSASESPKAGPPPPFGAAEVGGALPTQLSSALGLCPWAMAAAEMHAPKTLASASAARKRLAVEELVVMELAMEKTRRLGEEGTGMRPRRRTR